MALPIPGEIGQLSWLLALAWFIVYWVIGGAMFAVVALTRFLKIKKAQFSCLFSLASAAAAYGAATTGLMMGEPKVIRCLGGVDRPLEIVKAVFGCGAKEVFLAGGAWFALLILLNILLMLLSQREGKPVPPMHG